MESFIIDEYIHANDGALVTEEMMLERRLSPYATLRPGDLAGILKLHSALPFPGTGLPNKSSCSHGNLQFMGPYSANIHPSHKKAVEEAILEEVDNPGCQHHHNAAATDFVVDDEGDDGCNDDNVEDNVTVVCRGEDGNHIPAVYSVSGIKRHEMPVIGVYVDKRVCPGFRYRVRRVDTPGHYFFGGEARTLESVGMGYGQRLTFRGPTLNNNECYFWSDSEPNGFAFSIQAVDEGQRFLILDAEEVVVGEAVIEKIHEPQEELSMTSNSDGAEKTVAVTLTCNVTYYHQRPQHGLLDLLVTDSQETLTGEALLVKSRRGRQATLKSINSVFLQRIGCCTFIPDC